jgi:hypothetical protein
MKALLKVEMDDFVVRKYRYFACLPYNRSMNLNSAFKVPAKSHIQLHGCAPFGVLLC